MGVALMRSMSLLTDASRASSGGSPRASCRTAAIASFLVTSATKVQECSLVQSFLYKYPRVRA